MIVFEDRFWGEKNGGFDILYHNMKFGNNASVKIVEFIRERSAIEENYCKSLIKLAKSACSVSQLGTFEPLWGVLRVATEKLSNAHHQVVAKLHELVKEVKEYGDKQKERHKAAKEEFSTTAEIVQTIQTMTTSLTKAKESYYARCQEYEKYRKDGTSTKEIEKAEAKMKKAAEDYKGLVEKREIVRNEFHDKMVETCRKFQKMEEEHLKTIIGHLEQYIASHVAGWETMEKVHTEFREQVTALSVDKLLDQFVRSKGTGTNIPDVITFEEYVAPQENAELNDSSPSINSKIQTGHSFPIPHRRKKEKKDKKKTKKKKDKGQQQENHEPHENGPVDSPTSEGSEAASASFEVDEEGYRIRPPDTESAKSLGNSSDSDSDSDSDDEPRKIQVTIKPVDDRISSTASVDEIKKITESLSLSSPASMRKNLSSSSGLNEPFRQRARTSGDGRVSSTKLSRSSDDLLDIHFGHNSMSMTSPGSDTSLSSSNFKSPPSLHSINNSDASIKGIAGDLNMTNPLATTPTQATFTIGESSTSTPNTTGVETPPALPRKRSVPVNQTNLKPDDDSGNPPPPLPAKRGGAGSPPELPLNHPGLQKRSSSGVGISPAGDNGKPAVGDPSKSMPFLMMPPPGGEIGRSSSVSAALARPRPRGEQKNLSFTLPGSHSTQPTASQSSMSYSQELFSSMLDFTLTPSPENGNTEDTETPKSPKSPKTPSKVSYVGSVPLPNASSPAPVSQTMSRASTTSSLGVEELDSRAEDDPPLIRSKTVGAMPSLQNKMLAGRKEEGLPIAVAFIESVNAFFRSNDQKGCMTKVTGDITLSFPASIAAQLCSKDSPPSLTFQIKGTASLEQLVPNKTLILSEGQHSGGDIISYKFIMPSLVEHLKKQLEQLSSSYYNIDILKYEVRTTGIQSTPLQLCSYWKCEQSTTNIRVDYRYNSTSMSTACPLTNVSVIAPVNGGVTIMQSKPSATWSAENERAVWVIPEISNSHEPDGSMRAKFDVTAGPSTPSRIAVQFTCNGATISKLNFELKSEDYKLSLVKKKFSSGRYIAES